jgi:integrase
MAISVRRRGEIWHARGTVRVGREVVAVASVSTGCRRRADAEAWCSAEEARIRAEVIDGPAGRARRVTVAECLLAYLQRPGGVRERDRQPIGDMSAAMGARPLAEAPAAWREWVQAQPRHAPGTLARYRTVLSAALRFGARHHETDAPSLDGVRQPRAVSTPHLADAERARLLAAYSPAAGRVALFLAYQGSRTTETLLLDWRRVSWRRRSVTMAAGDTKSGKGRAVPMHRRVRVMLWLEWRRQGRPLAGPVFLSARGTPYADQREAGGGSPLATAHATACRNAGVTGFRIHDFRHDWAARMVMAGTDLYTLMRLGGWSSLKMVERYASVTADHMAEAVRRIA